MDVSGTAGPMPTEHRTTATATGCHTPVSHLSQVDTGQGDQLTKAGTETGMTGVNTIIKAWGFTSIYDAASSKNSLVTIVNCSLFYIRYKQKMDS